MAKKRFSKGFWRFRKTRNSGRTNLEYRRTCIEYLEPRFALSVAFGALPNSLTVQAGAPLNVALNGVDSSLTSSDPPPFYTFGTPVISNFNLSNPNVSASQLQASLATVLDPISNQSMFITVSDPQDGINGTMTLQLFEQLAPKTTSRIISLVNGTGNGQNGPFYDGLTFHRIIQGFMIQGGDPNGTGTGGSGAKFDDEFTPELQFTSAPEISESGILAMANSGRDTNDSQFFITDTPNNNPYRYGDFSYTIFGFLTNGQNILDAVNRVPTDSNDKPLHNVTMTSVTVSPDGANRTLHLSVPQGTTGTVDLTVSVEPEWDGTGTQPSPVTHTFHITIAADNNNDPPFLNAISTLRMTADTTFGPYQIPATDVEGDAITYGGSVSTTAGTTGASSNITLTVNSTTGQLTAQAKNDWAGVASLQLSATGSGSSSADTQAVPLVVNPAKPTLSLLTSSDTGSSTTDGVTNPNLAADDTHGTLAFNLSHLATGATVMLYIDGTAVGQGTATSSAMVMRTPTTFTWTEGVHTVTAQQTLSGSDVTVGNTTVPLGLASDTSDGLKVVVDTTVPTITSTAPASVVRYQQYAYNVQANEKAYDSQAGVTALVQYRVLTGPAGIQVDANSGAVTWTPGATAAASNPVTLRVTDLAGNLVDQSFNISVQDVNLAPTANAQTVREASATAKAVQLTGNDGNGGVQTLTYALASQPAHGTLTGFNPATGAVTFTSDAGYTGSDSFTFTVSDDTSIGGQAALTSSAATVSINVVPANSPPTANAQSVTTNEGVVLGITLTGSDGNPGLNQVLTYSIVSQPAHGTVQVLDAHAGTVQYTPTGAYNGSDSFTFRVTDDDKAEPASLQSGPATVSITVSAVNGQPIATPQSVTLDQNTSKAIMLTGDDNDPEVTQVLTFALGILPSHGTLTGLNPATGAVTYTPAAGYSGTDSFTFTVTDDNQAGSPGPLTSTAATVTLSVGSVNAPPTATPQNVTTPENSPVTFTLTGDDGDPEVQQTLRFNLVQGPTMGTITAFDPATGSVTYVPSAYHDGSDSFTFTVTDDAQAGSPANLTSAPATVSIQIARVEFPPQFTPVAPLSAFSGQTVQTTVRAVDPNIAPSDVIYSLAAGAPAGTTIDPQTGVLSVAVPHDTVSGTISVTVRATKLVSGAPGATQTVQVNVLNPAALLIGPTTPSFAPTPVTANRLTASLLTSELSPAVSLPIQQPQFAFGQSDLVEPQGFFTYSFAPDRGGNSHGPQTETLESKPESIAPGRKIAPPDDSSGAASASQERTDDSRADAGSDKSLREGHARYSVPGLYDAALEDFTDGGEWVDVPDQVVETETLLASND